VNKILLISVRPRFATKLLDGEKTAELRRVRPRVGPGDWVLIYASSPMKALVAASVVEDVVEGRPTWVWREARDRAAVTKREFISYFEGAITAFAIFLEQPKRLPAPVPLGSIRRNWPEFSPPQSYRYLTPEDARRLCSWIFTGGSL
jgi:predicted transcriptional regulator